MRASRFIFIVLFSCLVICSSSSAQQRRSSAAPSKPQIKFDSAPFNLKTEQLPANYYGHSYGTVIAGLLRREKVAVKSEFESTIDYKARLAQYDKQPLAGAIYFDSLFAFSIDPDDVQFKMQYDADLTVLNITLQWKPEYLIRSYSERIYTLPWSRSSRLIRTYVGRTAFGRTARVKTYRYDQFLIGCDESRLPKVSNKRILFATLETSIFMQPNDARIAKQNLRALVIGWLADKPLLTNESHETATITDPYEYYNFTYVINLIPEEVWFYDITTGAVLIKVKSD